MRVGEFRRRVVCALCASTGLVDVLDLGRTPAANAFVPAERMDKEQEIYPLVVCLCEVCGHLQLRTLVDPTRLFGDYTYTTGTSPVTIAHLEEQAATAVTRFGLVAPFVIEVGSNDGTALRIWRDKYGARVLGVDPATAIATKAAAAGIPTEVAFFSPAVAHKIVASEGFADVVIANNVLAHAPDLIAILSGVRRVLARDGVFIAEVSYLGDILEHGAFDTIYHEHFSYHAIRPLQRALAWMGFRLFDVALNPNQLGRGSLRLYIGHEDSRHRVHARVAGLIAEEENAGFFEPATYERLRISIEARGGHLREQLDAHIAAGHLITGYGAPAKLTTLMYTAGLSLRHCAFIAEDSAWKCGRATPGLHIPIVPVESWRQVAAEACVIWAWNFAEAIMQRHRDYKGTWIIPLPTYRTVLAR